MPTFQKRDLLSAQLEVKEIRKEAKELARLVLLKRRHAEAVLTVLQFNLPKVDFSAVTPIRTQPRISGLPHGKMTRLIKQCLHAAGGAPVKKKDIVDYVRRTCASDKPSTRQRSPQERTNYNLFSYCIRMQLKTLGRKGILQRHPPTIESRESSWTVIPITQAR